jgi:hypothetical protein
MNHENRWLIVVVASSVVAVLATIAAIGDALSMAELLWFLAVIPGLPYVRMLWKHADPVAFWLTVVGLSLAIDTVVAEALLYAHAFSAVSAVSVLAGVACLGAVVGQLRTPAVDPEPAEPVGMPSSGRS